MTASMIAQLIIAFGPGAIDLIQKLIAVWDKPSLTVQEVQDICAVAKKSYDSYIADIKAALVPPTTPTP